MEAQPPNGPAGTPAAPLAPPAAPPVPLEGTEWRLTDHLGPAGGLVPVPGDVMATAVFADGRVAGGTGCNRYNGSCRVDEGRLAVASIAMTMMACEPERTAVESAFMSALEAAATFAISGDALELADTDGRVALRFRAAPAPSLTGARWVATGINNGRGGVAGVLAGVEVTAEFDADGQVAGSGGCNQFSGRFTLQGDSLTIGPVASTTMACFEPEGVGEQESAYFAALARVASWSFREDRLQLRAADGALQVEFRPAPTT